MINGPRDIKALTHNSSPLIPALTTMAALLLMILMSGCARVIGMMGTLINTTRRRATIHWRSLRSTSIALTKYDRSQARTTFSGSAQPPMCAIMKHQPFGSHSRLQPVILHRQTAAQPVRFPALYMGETRLLKEACG